MYWQRSGIGSKPIKEEVLLGLGIQDIQMQGYLRITEGSREIMAQCWWIFILIWDSYAG
jgi:hypothetical protein